MHYFINTLVICFAYSAKPLRSLREIKSAIKSGFESVRMSLFIDIILKFIVVYLVHK